MIPVASKPVLISPGFYPLEVEFFEAGGGEGLELRLYGGGSEWQPVPQNMLFRRLGER